MTTVFLYDIDSGEYRGDTVAAESPLEPGVPLIPLSATLQRPPALGQRQAAVFDGHKWNLVPDWRGVPLFHIADGSPATVPLGVLPVEAGATDQAYPGPEYVWGSGGWAYDAQRAAALFRQRQEDAVIEVANSIARLRDVASGGASPGEMAARAAKRLAAEAVLAGNATEAQLLNVSIEALLRGMAETPETLAAKIVARAQALDALNAKLDGLKRAAENALRATASDDELRGRVASFLDQVAAVVTAVQASET